jgi:hypothetical protein
VAGDITRNTFDPLKHYSGVRQQQGRVSVDADWNEQADIAAYRVRTETADVLGRTGAPRDNAGFFIIPLPQTGPSSDLALTPGRMYVDGILCELEATLVSPTIASGTPQQFQIQLTSVVLDGRELAKGQWVEISAADPTAPNPLATPIQSVSVAANTITVKDDVSGFSGKAGLQLGRVTTYLTQPDSPSAAPLPTSGAALVYLDVWERNITAFEDGGIRDPALGPSSGADTTTRTKTVWQVKWTQQQITSATTCSTAPGFAAFTPQSTGQLAARSEPTAAPTSACILPPRAGFRRLENQLYRIEVHTPGSPGTGGKPTFKWSRDNGSVVSAITSPAPVLSGTTLTLNVSSLGRDQVLGFAPGQIVELIEDGLELSGQPGILVKLTSATQGPQGPMLTADTSITNADFSAFTNQTARNPRVRRWDQSGAQVSTRVPGGDVPLQEGVWTDLESGVQVFFEPGGNYATGDYWLVPARTVTGDVIWPQDSSRNPQFRPPQGIKHHYCRLGIVSFGPTPPPAGGSPWSLAGDCRQLFAPLADNGLHVTGVSLNKQNPTGPLTNDAPVLLADLLSGITIVCDLPIDQASLFVKTPSFPGFPTFPTAQLNKPSCFVTINVPTATAGGHAVQPMIVAANLALDGTGTNISWNPTPDAITGLNQIFGTNPSPGALLAHLTLRGNYIWARGNPSLFLDGETFGGPDSSGNQRTNLFSPSGDGRRGGDFEMWFWVTAPPSGTVVVSPTTIDFGSLAVNASATQPVTVTNNTAASVTLAISIDDTTDFTEAVAPDSSTTLAVNASATINVTFKPPQAGFKKGTMTITPGGQVTLTGTALAAVLQPSPAAVSFLATFVGESVDQTLTLTNIGSLPLTINSVTIGGVAGGDYFTPNLAGTVLAPGGDANLDVTFTPSLIGPRNASLTVAHTGNNSPVVVPLTGTGRRIIIGGGGTGGGGGIIGGGGGRQVQKILLQ